MIGGVVLAGVVLGSVVAQTGYHAFEKQVSETQGELTADPKDALPDQKTIEANKKKNETERKQEEQQEQEDEKEDEITISVDEATPVDLDSYVQIQPVSSKASSELDDNTAEKAIDGQEVTSWQEDVAGYGHGENLTLKFEKTYTVKYLALKLGSWKDDAAYEQNNRPKELDIQTDHLIRKVTFSDEKKEYWVTFSDTCKTSELKLIIEQVYRGLKTSWNDTCLSLPLFLLGPPSRCRLFLSPAQAPAYPFLYSRSSRFPRCPPRRFLLRSPYAPRPSAGLCSARSLPRSGSPISVCATDPSMYRYLFGTAPCSGCYLLFRST